MAFKKSEAQELACEMLNGHTHGLLFGGSRSGKTTIIVRNILLRASKTPSRHFIARFRFNHVKTSIWYDTIPKVARIAFPGIELKYNKSDWFITVPCAGGGESQIWIGGVDDKERVEKILGNEYSTIYTNECSQISHEAILMLRTRLAENSGLALKFYYDLNPSGKKHWSYQEFIAKRIVGTKQPNTLDCGHRIINPYDNQDNLPKAYLDILESLPPKQKKRFLDGQFMSDIDGALWTQEMVDHALVMEYGDPIKTVIAVDPAVTHNEDSDETGIIVCSMDANKNAIIEDDLSGKYSTRDWAQKAIDAYHYYEANEIVVETNQGGDLVIDALKSIDKSVPVKSVKASKGKFARAEPVAALYEQGKVAHAKQLPELELQLTEWVPLGSKKSPDRLDALVWGVTHLLLREKDRKVRVRTL
jgi:PBSX family phage terminase large subunit